MTFFSSRTEVLLAGSLTWPLTPDPGSCFFNNKKKVLTCASKVWHLFVSSSPCFWRPGVTLVKRFLRLPLLLLAPSERLEEAGEESVLSRTHWLTESQTFLLLSHSAVQTAAFFYIPVPLQYYLTLLVFFFIMYLFAWPRAEMVLTQSLCVSSVQSGLSASPSCCSEAETQLYTL